jgi:hypothetical protein
MLRQLHSALFVSLVISSLGAAAWADNPRLPPTPTEFEQLIGRIRKAAASGEWKQPAWKDEKLETDLGKLVEAARATAGKAGLKLPVKFQDVTAGAAPRAAGLPGGMLQVATGNVEVGFANKSIFLVDGSIRIAHCADCVVIARGIVEISHGNRNLILAGHHADISFDGMDGRRAAAGGRGVAPPLADGSLIVSGGSIHVSHAQGSICSAPKLIDISHAAEVAFLASPDVKMSHQVGCSEHKDFATPLPLPPAVSLPASVFSVKQIVAPDDRTKQLVTVERNGKEYVLRPGAKLVDEKAEPITGWGNWTVGFITDHVVLFTDGQDDVSFRLPE